MQDFGYTCTNSKLNDIRCQFSLFTLNERLFLPFPSDLSFKQQRNNGSRKKLICNVQELAIKCIFWLSH